jgi:hypothetical protein
MAILSLRGGLVPRWIREVGDLHYERADQFMRGTQIRENLSCKLWAGAARLRLDLLHVDRTNGRNH